MTYREWLPRRGPGRRTEITANARRAGVRVLTRMTAIPALRPLGEAGMRALFNSVAPQWDRIRAEPVYREAFIAALRQVSEKLPGAGAPRAVLDVACGTGLATDVLSQAFPNSRVVGVDISPKMIELASEGLPGVELVVGSSTGLPFADGEFDLVTSLDGVFEAEELARVCAPGGVVLVVYSLGGKCPVARQIDKVSATLEAQGMEVVTEQAESWVVYARRPA